MTKTNIIKGVYQHLGVTLKHWLTPKSWSTLIRALEVHDNNVGVTSFKVMSSYVVNLFVYVERHPRALGVEFSFNRIPWKG